jgi:hypothetical protein
MGIVLKYNDGTGLLKNNFFFFLIYFPWAEAKTRFKVSSEHVAYLCGSQDGDTGLKSLVVYNFQNALTLHVILIPKLPFFYYWYQLASVNCMLPEHMPSTQD